MTHSEIKIKVRDFLAKLFKAQALHDDDDIFAAGFVNSLFAMQLVLFVEKTFTLTVENEDLELDNFRTVNTITQFVERKLTIKKGLSV